MVARTMGHHQIRMEPWHMKTVLISVALVATGFIAAAAPPEDMAGTPTTTTTSTTTTTIAPITMAPSLAAAIRTNRNDFTEALDRLDGAFAGYPPPTDLEQWVDGYTHGGGPTELIPVFLDAIIPCESGGQVDVVSRTHDYGLAQINRAVHSTEVERIWSGHTFEDLMVQAYPNGYFAGVLASRNGTGDWYMSKHCSGHG